MTIFCPIRRENTVSADMFQWVPNGVLFTSMVGQSTHVEPATGATIKGASVQSTFMFAVQNYGSLLRRLAE